jgi:hypothetical protein
MMVVKMMMILPKLLGNLFYQTHLPFISQACIPTIQGYIYIYMDYSKGCTDRHITVPHPIGLGSHQHWSIDALIAWVSFIFYFFSTHGGTRAADLQENSIIPIFMACRINVYDFLELVLNFSIVRSFISPYHLE